MTWVVDRNDYDEVGYLSLGWVNADGEWVVREFPTVEEARGFVQALITANRSPEIPTWRIRPYEMDSSTAHLQEHYGRPVPTREPSMKVVIEVLGGVATVAACPAGVEVEIIDYDNAEDY